jgi:hypothetical protein
MAEATYSAGKSVTHDRAVTHEKRDSRHAFI